MKTYFVLQKQVLLHVLLLYLLLSLQIQTDKVFRHKTELKFKRTEDSHERHAYMRVLVIPGTSNSVTSLSADLTHS